MEFTEIKPDVSGWKRISDHYSKEKIEGMPKITTVIPTHNSGHLLTQTIESWIFQKNVDKELIIVDADSEDHTTAILEKYHEHISRVYYVTYDNICLMINKGFSLATGGYVSFILPGMFYLNQYCLCHIARMAKQDLSPDVVFSGTYLAWPDFSPYKDALKKSPDQISPQFIYFPFNKTWLKRGFLPTAPSSIWFNTGYFKKVGGLQYRSQVLRKSIYDLCCRIAKDKNVKISTTFWSTTHSEGLIEKQYLNQADIFRTWPVVLKHFGLFDALAWAFRDKPMRIFRFLVVRLISFFRE